MEIASATGSRRELMTAEMHLRSSVKQVESVFEKEKLGEEILCYLFAIYCFLCA